MRCGGGGRCVGATDFSRGVLIANPTIRSWFFTAHERAAITESPPSFPVPRTSPARPATPGRACQVQRHQLHLLDYRRLCSSILPSSAGGPLDRAGSTVDNMADFLSQRVRRTSGGHDASCSRHQAGIVGAPDSRARLRGAPSFLALGRLGMDAAPTTNPVVSGLPDGYSGFTDMLFAHAIEGTYSVPEATGSAVGRTSLSRATCNRGLHRRAGFRMMTHGLRPYQHQPTVDVVLRLLTVTAPPPVKPDRPV